MKANAYTNDWFDTFLRTVDPAQTRREVEFLRRLLPSDRFARVLDVCCGLGRHGGALAENGYDVVGIERDASLVAEAKRLHPAVEFLSMDVRDLATFDRSFDAAICMWQSFGQFDRTGNEEVLRDIATHLRPGGRFVLDIYNRRFFESRQGTLESTRDGRAYRESKYLNGDRLTVQLAYDADAAKGDRFDWEVFTPESIAARAAAQGLRPILSCSGFDENNAVSNDIPRMQILFESD